MNILKYKLFKIKTFFNVNLTEEQSEIINRAEEGSSEPPGGTVPVMIIGNNNVFEVS